MPECSLTLVNQFISTKKPISVPSSMALLITGIIKTKPTNYAPATGKQSLSDQSSHKDYQI